MFTNDYSSGYGTVSWSHEGYDGCVADFDRTADCKANGTRMKEKGELRPFQ